MTRPDHPQNVISYDSGKEEPTMTYLIHPDHTVHDDRERSLCAAERYELERALRTAQEQERAERKARRTRRVRRYARLVLGRVA